jgi:hypothetical protein
LTQDEQETRALSYLLKSRDCPTEGLTMAGREMATLIQGPCTLIPCPSCAGDTAANVALCRTIAALGGFGRGLVFADDWQSVCLRAVRAG